MDKMTKKILTVFVVVVVAALAIFIGVRAYQQKEAEEKAEASLPKTEVGKLLAKDLDLEYPGTPTEVVKLFWRINKCLYNTNMKEKDQKALSLHIVRIQGLWTLSQRMHWSPICSSVRGCTEITTNRKKQQNLST